MCCLYPSLTSNNREVSLWRLWAYNLTCALHMSSECESERCQGHLWPHFQQLVSPWRIVPRLAGPFKCLPISGSINKQACLLGRIRNEGETEAILLHVRQELCWNKHLSTPTNDRRERSRWQSKERKRAPIERKVDQSVQLFSSLSFMFFSPSNSSFLSLPQTT